MINHIKSTLRVAAVAAIITTAAQAQAQLGAPTPTPGPLPAIPAGLVIGTRTLDRQDTQTTGETIHGQAYIGALTQEGEYGRKSALARAYLWFDSDSSTYVVLGASEGGLSLNSVSASADVVSVRVHDEAGNVVAVSQRVYRLAGGFVESTQASVRLDAQGRLLPLPMVRLTQAEDGTITATRDGDFSEALIVQFRVVPSTVTTGTNVPQQLVTIPAHAASATVPVTPQEGDTVTLRAGNGYTPAPAENSDVLQF